MPYVLPTSEPRRQWYNDVGEAQGLTARLLLAMLSGGASGVPSLGQNPTAPTPGNPGQIQFPSGARTTTSPLEQALIAQQGGVPTTQGTMQPVTYRPPTRFGLQPNIGRQLQQAQLQKAQQDLDPNSPINQYIKSLTKAPSSQGNQDQGSVGFTQQLATLRQSAENGDEASVKKLRIILQLLQAQ